MPKNADSSSGMAEDLTRAFVQMGCAESHLMTLYQKTLSELDNGLIDMDDPDTVNAHIEKAEQYRDDLIQAAQLRREMMKYCFDLFPDGDKDVWCMVKHLGISSMCAWETWQASDDDPALLSIAVDSNRMFTRYLTQFFGMEITDCASCLSDMLKSNN